MCAVSMVSQGYYIQYPNPYTMPAQDYFELLELRKRAAEFDKLRGMPDCPEPEKAKWFKELEEVMKRKPKFI